MNAENKNGFAAQKSRSVAPVEKVWLNIKEAAYYLGVSQRTMRDYKDSALISFYKPAGVILFSKKDLDRFVEKGKVI